MEGDEVKCIHHWVIETPNGPVNMGVCKKCGEEKGFPVIDSVFDGYKGRSGKFSFERPKGFFAKQNTAEDYWYGN